ncbi:hypothetical protein MLD38_002001 [Melastoma candidum]|uniref:Uncharacterized protein n=1 Tax=Melastoma candidum TaxID=119954 RepID=A0ACB9SF57_9MYRT|nr:hypothetical protein MLD38_002001 [Melastoma candidum]
MLVPWVIGFPSLAVVVAASSLAVPLLFLVARWRWEFSVARNEEVSRLLESASEEAARAEVEALQSWRGGGPEETGVGLGLGSAGSYYCCAVCYSPTTTRCSRCKAVRYCSGKCQIVHWRQGHREECHPREVLGDSHGTFSRSSLKGCTDGIVEHPKENPCNEPVEILTNQEGRTKSSSVNVLVDEERRFTESPASSPFSGFSSSIAGSESSDDLSEHGSVNSDDSGKSTVPSSPNAPNQESQTSHPVALKNKDDGCSPNFSMLMDVVGDFKDSVKLHGGKEINGGYAIGHLNYQSSLHKHGMDKAAFSSSFWSSNLNPDEQKKHGHDVSSNIIPGSAHDSAMPDSKPALRFSFSLSENATRRAQNLDFKDSSMSMPDNLEEKIKCGSPGGTALMRNKSSRSASDKGLSGLRHSRSVGIDSLSSTSRNADFSFNSQPVSLRNGKRIVAEKTMLGEAGDTASTSAAGRLPSAKNGLRTSVWKVLDQFRGSVLVKHPRTVVGSDMLGRGNSKALLSYKSFAKLYSQKRLELRPCGLVNCGNSCYANVVLQCLAFTPPLTAFFLQGLHSEACSRSDWCFTCEFEHLVLKFKEGKSPVSPIGIVSHLRNIGSQLSNGKEEDAHEFLRCVIDRMQSDFLRACGKKVSGSKEEEMTLIGLTFGGYLRSKIRCLRCNRKTERQERLMDLTVEIDGDIRTLEEALRRFTGSETLDGENKYQCSRCKTYEKARKKLTVLEAPNILTIAFKRYQSGKYGKLNKAISLSEIIDLASVIDGWKDGPAVYRLYGVIVHVDIMDSAFSGHYICYVKDTQDRWFKIDDSSVRPTELERVLTEGAYMLLYARCSPRAPRLAHGECLLNDPKKIGARNARAKTPTGTNPSRTQNDNSTATSYSRFHRSSTPRDDSSSDASSLFSSNSDGSTYSRSSTQDSSSIDDLSNYIFGETGFRDWAGSPWSTNSSEQDASSQVFSR